MPLTIDRFNGIVKLPDGDNGLSFEVIEEVYKYIKPVLEKRRAEKIPECSNREQIN